MYAYRCIYINTCVYKCIHTHINICVYKYIYVYIYVYTYIHKYMYIYCLEKIRENGNKNGFLSRVRSAAMRECEP